MTRVLLLLLATGWVLELLVQSQVVLLGAAEPAVLTDPGPLPAVSPGVYEESGLLTEHLVAHLALIALVVYQVLMFVSQLI